MAQYGGRRTSHIRQMCVALRSVGREDDKVIPEPLKAKSDDTDSD